MMKEVIFPIHIVSSKLEQLICPSGKNGTIDIGSEY
jgi:hypothetical protein